LRVCRRRIHIIRVPVVPPAALVYLPVCSSNILTVVTMVTNNIHPLAADIVVAV
jgi:hypothetical protein